MHPLTQNHFELFGLPVRFEVDRPALDAAYRQVQATVHPDRHASSGDTERRLAMQLATQANEAYRTLRDPISRGAYLCGLNGIDLKIETNTAMPPEFLMQQMQWREQLDDVRDARDPAGLAALERSIGTARDGLLAELSAACDERRDFDTAGALVRRLHFIDRIEREIESVADTIDAH